MNRGLIFDMDGVVVNNDRYHCFSWIEFAERHGKKVGFDEVKSWFGNTNKTILENLFDNKLSMEQIKTMGNEKEEIYRKMYAPDIKPVEGLGAFLASIDDTFHIGLATSAPPENVAFVLKETGLNSYFDSVTDASDITIGKPDPEIFMKAAEKLGIKPDQCLVFEDSFHGIEAGRRAGMLVVGVATTHSKEGLNNTDYVIRDFTEINVDILNEIFISRGR